MHLKQAASLWFSHLNQRTRSGYPKQVEYLLRCHLLPTLGSRPLIEVSKRDLIAVNGRERIESDWMMDAPGWEEFNGPKPKGPTIGERQQLHREYGSEIDRLMSRPSAGMQAGQPEDQMPATAEQLAEQLHREFVSAYKDLAGDASAIERIARSEIDAETRRAGGVYLWRSMDAARRARGAAWLDRVRHTYGSEPSLQYFETPLVADNAMGQTTDELDASKTA